MRLGLIGLGRIGSFHAHTLSQLPAVDTLVVTDALPAVTRAVAERVGAQVADSPDSLISSGVDGLVIAAATTAHTELIRAGVEAGIPVFCEKPLSADLSQAVAIARYVGERGVPVQIGYPRRFDPAFAAARAAVEAGELGWVHTVRSTTLDPAPAPRAYIQTSGGIFRDCSVHDFDTVRWVTGREVVEVYATGSARGDDFFAEFGDVATAQTLLTFDDGATAVVSNARYNARGHDVRLELHGTHDSVAAGWTDAAPLRNLEPGASWPAGPPANFFMDRLATAFQAELSAFVDVVAGQRVSPCTVDDAVAVAFIAEAATLSLREHRPVLIDEVRGGDGTSSMQTGPMKILLWHVHGSWTTAFVQGRHDYVLPVLPDRGADGVGRARTWNWPSSVRECSPAELTDEDVDLVVLQRPHELELVRDWLGRAAGIDLPAIYLEHNAPDERPCTQRHPLADRRDIPIAHVTFFNELYWDNGSAPTTVIEHGVVDPGPRYTGEIPSGAVVVNEPGRRGRIVGADLVPRFAGVGPVDLFGMQATPFVSALGTAAVTAHDDLDTQDQMHTEIARRRVYLHPMRWTSLGLSLIEAMHLAMPVVALAATEVAEAVPAAAGVVSTNPTRLLAAFQHYLDDPEAAAEAGRHGREAALARYGLARFLRDWDQLLDSVLAGGRGATGPSLSNW